MFKSFLKLPQSDSPDYKQTVNKVLNNAPTRYRSKLLDDSDIYWNSEVDLYYIKSTITERRKRNALVFCMGLGEWRSSTRFNAELDEQSIRFIKLPDLKKQLDS